MADEDDGGGSAAGKIYLYSSQSYTPAQWYQQLKHMRDRRGAAAWWASFQPVLREVQGVDECFIECTLCKKLLSASNPSQRAKSHLSDTGCAGLKEIAAAAAATLNTPNDLEDATSAAAAAVASAKAAATAVQRAVRTGVAAQGMVARVVTAPQHLDFQQEFALFLCKAGVPLHLTRHPALKKALAVVGAQPPSLRQVSGPLLKRGYDSVKSGHLEALALAVWIQLATDGWRRRAAAGGDPLFNIMALLPNGGSIFHGVRNAAGVTKDATWLKDSHVEWAMEVTDNKPDRLLGMVMDNTKANR
jgi:hypothetical protein